jgi:hypothetical protein
VTPYICPDPPDLEPLRRALIQTAVAAGILVVLQIVFRRRVERAAKKIWIALSWIANRPVLCGLALFALVIVARVAVLPRFPVPVPGIHDEFSYLLMGDMFAHGRLSNLPHPMWMSFETFHVNWFPRYASMYPPAQGMVLAVGQLLGSPWIGVVLSCAAMCWAIYWMLLGWLPPRWALLGGMLVWLKFCIVSYWVNSYWGGAAAAIGGAMLLGALTRILRRPSLGDALLFALGLAILANSRPYEGFLFALPSLFVLARWLLHEKSGRAQAAIRWRVVALPCAGVLLLAGSFMLFYNWRLTGNPFLMPHTLNVRTYHSAPMVLFQSSKPVKHYHNQQFEDFYNGWEREEYDHSWASVGCLSWLKSVRFFSAYAWWGMLLAAPALWLVLRGDKMWLPWIALLLVAAGSYAVVWSNAHYQAPATCVVLLLYIQALRRLRLVGGKGWNWGAILARTSVLLLVVDTASAVVQKQCDTFYWTCRGDVSRLLIQRKLEGLPGKHLVMVRYGDDHNIHDEWVYNGAEIDSAKLVWAREISEEQDGKLFEYFRDRQVWLVTPDSDNTYLAPYTPPADR